MSSSERNILYILSSSFDDRTIVSPPNQTSVRPPLDPANYLVHGDCPKPYLALSPPSRLTPAPPPLPLCCLSRHSSTPPSAHPLVRGCVFEVPGIQRAGGHAQVGGEIPTASVHATLHHCGARGEKGLGGGRVVKCRYLLVHIRFQPWINLSCLVLGLVLVLGIVLCMSCPPE